MEKALPTVPLAFDSMHELLMHHVENFPDKEAVIAVHPDKKDALVLSYKKLVNLIFRTAKYLSEIGIKRNDRFAILMHNAPEVLIFELAGSLIGATTVPLDFNRDTPERKIFKLRDTASKSLFIKFEDLQNVKEQKYVKKECPGITITTWGTFQEFEKLLPDDKLCESYVMRSLNSHYVILYTSGTTALPKGVLLSARACLLNAAGIADWQKFTPSDRFNIILPLHHINSTEFYLSMLLAGGTVILNSRYSAANFWRTISTYKATNTSIVPTVLHDLLVRADEFHNQRMDISSLKRICIGSAPVLPEETLKFYNTFNIRVVQGYGQTETALRVAGVPVNVSEDTYKQLVKSNTIGVELANNVIAILDKDGHEAEENTEGEICIGGPVLADGYLNNPKDSSASFKNNWFHSGDLGKWKMIAGKKYFFIIGRIKEIIIKGGVNISPSAIEDALLSSFPAIDEVSVVGYPDERMGEEIAAAVVLKMSHLTKQGETVQTHILTSARNGKMKGLSPFETPKKIFFFDRLPKTSTGKIQRVEIKKIVGDLIKKDGIKHYFVRKIAPDESKILIRAVSINNDRWHGLPATLRDFTSRAQYGILWGIFEETEGLVGTLSCVRLNLSVVKRIRTWNEATSNGTCKNHNPNGDTLLCIAISVKSSSSNNITIQQFNNIDVANLKQLVVKNIANYIKHGNDHVLEFHKKPKGGIPGAEVWKILPNGRPEDREAMGFNVLMKYPVVHPLTKLIRSNAPTPATLLIEHALLYSIEHGISHVIAFSRPAGLKNWLITNYLTKP